MAATTTSSGSAGVPPGFRFHPTDEELLQYYLRKKVALERFDLEVIREVDVNRVEPWELQERCRIGSAPQNEWYFFSHKDRKYPAGSRTNRATTSGFWKATGRDKCIRNSYRKIGMRKTLVFYCGRAPHGLKTDWIMHEFRLEEGVGADEGAAASEEGWVVCRVFKKKNFFKVPGEKGAGTLGDRPPGHLPMIDPIYLHHEEPAGFVHLQVPEPYKPEHPPLHYPQMAPPKGNHQYYSHLQLQNFLPDHRASEVGYGFSSVLPGESSASGAVDVRAPYRVCEGGVGVGEPMQLRVAAGEGRDRGSGEWALLDRMMSTGRLGEGDAAAAAAAEGRYGGTEGPLPPHEHRPAGEMDLWGYGK
ncbi:hypothetical protein Taro_034799 [Colocasia esculenta]|uniref:NAC domain-containing protein n=1 Tax=Colocasia esculenta TaxID=4460 RepID=A0A843W8N2_COLES|nr:hypothetical protein [Colocasia esculenta]